MKKIVLLISVIILTSCNFKNNRLLSYESIFMGEDEKNYDLMRNQIKPTYKDGKIYISEVITNNSCGEYEGNIKFKGDSIFLIQNNKSFVACASVVFVRVNYVIDNSKNKKYKFDFKYK